MPATPEKLTIDPQGLAVTVDILDQYSQSQTTYTASGGASTHTLPLAISSATDFFLTEAGVFTVSAKFAGVEIANTTITVGAGVPAVYKVQPLTVANLASLLADRANIATAPTTYTQTYSTAASTVPNATYSAPSVTVTAHTFPASGNLFDAVAADLLINVRTDSVANAVADVVVNEKSIADNLNQLITDEAATVTAVAALAADVLALKKVITQIVDDLQACGLAG